MDDDAQDRADKILEQRVRRETIVDNRLDGHDRRLATINGQLERGARATELVAERLNHLEGAIVNLRTDFTTKSKVDEALKRRADDTLKQQVTHREFWMGIVVIVISFMSVAVNAHIFG